jgi:hypothetical protein
MMQNRLFALIAYLLIAVLHTQCDETDPNDPVDIPDKAFLHALISAGVDTNGDSLISYMEAEAIEVIALSNYDHPCWPSKKSSLTRIPKMDEDIRSFEGLQAFINLREFGCCGLGISHLDVSGNRKLTHLICGFNDLSSLDVSYNTDLVVLECGGNLLTELDLQNNVKLGELWVEFNPLESLNLNGNLNLNLLYCAGNPMTDLNLSVHGKMKSLSLIDMPNMSEVCIWTKPFPPYWMELDTTGSPNVFFTTECSQ